MTDEVFLVKLSPKKARLLELLAELQGCDRSEALSRAISTEAFMQAEMRQGTKILLQSTDGDEREIVLSKCK